ncbi:hypothetical protein CVT26_013071 [Gymnopilus dilepis]|uniref:F-box domain-containing protein n=1 Tax=Gymnopilus dilepis TaxID=231916 RepID=A0A409WD23_9AGAR|nr:hypothetical protein CVT26_013071 [Gymnopilus dilepis]
MAIITDVPVEILFYVATFLPRSSVLALLRTCRQLFRVYAVELYTSVDVRGLQARMLALTILTSQQMDYGGMVKKFIFRGEDTNDHLYLTYPLLTDALACMNRLIRLTLIMSSSHATYFASLMGRHGMYRVSNGPLASIHDSISDNPPSSRYVLPAIRELTCEGDVELVKLAMNRRLTHLTIRSCLNSGTLCNVMEWTQGSILHTLDIKLFISTTMELVLILYGVSESCPNLRRLQIATGMFNALDISHALSTSPPLFPNLRELWFNQRYLLPPVHGSPVIESFNIQRDHLNCALDHLPYLCSVKFGLVDWTVVESLKGRKWRSEYFHKEIWLGPQWAGFSGDFSCLYLKE